MILKATVNYAITNHNALRWAFPFDYLNKKFVKILLLREGGRELLTYPNDYAVENKEVILKAPIRAEAHTIRIFRETTTERIVTWSDGSILKAADMTLDELQGLHIDEETRDFVWLNALCLNGEDWDARDKRITNVANPIEDKDAVNLKHVKEHTIYLDPTDDTWDARHKRIKNVAKPINPEDAVNKQYLEDETIHLNHSTNKWEGKMKTLANLDDPKEPKDAVNLEYLEKYSASHAFNAPEYDPTKMYYPPDVVIGADGNYYRCIAPSIGEEPATSNKWVQIAAVVCRTFEPDTNGDLMPRLIPRVSQNWTIDNDGQIMPA